MGQDAPRWSGPRLQPPTLDPTPSPSEQGPRHSAGTGEAGPRVSSPDPQKQPLRWELDGRAGSRWHSEQDPADGPGVTLDASFQLKTGLARTAQVSLEMLLGAPSRPPTRGRGAGGRGETLECGPGKPPGTWAQGLAARRGRAGLSGSLERAQNESRTDPAAPETAHQARGLRWQQTGPARRHRDA